MHLHATAFDLVTFPYPYSYPYPYPISLPLTLPLTLPLLRCYGRRW